MHHSDEHSPFPAEIHVQPWDDPVIEAHGYLYQSLYFETFWLPKIGPSCTVILRQLERSLDAFPDGFIIDSAALAASVGLGHRGMGRNGPFGSSLDRIVYYGFAEWRANDWSVMGLRRKAAPLPALKAQRWLPEHLLDTYRAVEAGELVLQ